MIKTVNQGTLEYLTAEDIAAPHCFTTRLGGVSTGIYDSLNLSLSQGDDNANVVENYRRIGRVLGFSPEDVVNARQIHSDRVIRVGRSSCGKLTVPGASPVCDGLITDEPGVTLFVSTADCTPILLWDSKTGAVGAVHAGWRGTAADIAGKAVKAMVREFGCDPVDLRAAIGPNIGQCCFETDREVPDALIVAFGPEAQEFIRREKEKFFPDLKQINALALRRAGVSCIEISRECTMCRHDRFWSHRYTRGVRGAQGAIICCKEVRP